jgi:hypothetical protein
MSFQPDIADDCLLVDGVETVTLHGTSAIAVDGAKRGRLALSEIEFRQVGLEASDITWILPVVSLAGVEPRRGDAIEDAAGVHWTILSVARSPLSGVWRAVTRKQI